MSTTIKLFTTNDIHGHFLNEGDELDFARLATLKENTQNALLIDAGDATQGTPFTVLKKGISPIQLMNKVGYDITTIGNHEFDNITKDDVATCELDTIIKTFSGDFIACNVMKKTSSTSVNYIQSLGKGNGSYSVKTIAGKKLLFIGVATPDMSLDTKRMEDFEIHNIDGIVKDIELAIQEAKKNNAIDAIILVSHLGLRGDTKSLDLAKKVSGVNLIIDGHSHDEYNQIAPATNTLVVQTGCYGKKFSEITLIFDTEVNITCHLRDATYLKNYARNNEVQTWLEKEKEELNKVFAQQWSTGSNCTLWGGAIDEKKPYVRKAVNIARYAETNLGRVVCDAMVETVRVKKDEFNFSLANNKIKDDELIVGAINGGAVRASIAANKSIRSYDLYTAFPSPLNSKNESGISVFRITLKELKTILENSICRITYDSCGKLVTSDGRFLNVAGLGFRISKNSQNKLIIDSDITLYRSVGYTWKENNYNLVKDQDKTILFVTTKYLATGGDGYETLKNKTPIANSHTALFQLTGEYMYRQCNGNRFIADYTYQNSIYDGFNFPKPTDIEILCTDENGKKIADDFMILQFHNSIENSYKVVKTDANGILKVTPPDGNSVLSMLYLQPVNMSIKAMNKYCELYFHTYYMLMEDKKLSACFTNVENKLFPSAPFSIFKHTFSQTKTFHYSNYTNYINWNNEECTYIILNNEIYTCKKNQREFQKTEEIQYISSTGSKETFKMELSYFTWGKGIYTNQLLF